MTLEKLEKIVKQLAEEHNRLEARVEMLNTHGESVQAHAEALEDRIEALEAKVALLAKHDRKWGKDDPSKAFAGRRDEDGA